LRSRGLDQLEPLQARVPLLADDDVVMHLDAEIARHVDDLFGHFDIGARRRGVAAWMVMQQYNWRRKFFHAFDFCAFES